MAKNRIKFLLAMAVFLATLLGTVIAWRTLESAAALALRDRLRHFSEKIGVQLSFDDLQLGLGIVTLYGVSVGDDSSIQIEKIRISADIDLLDPQILNPKEIQIVRPAVSMTRAQLEAFLSHPLIDEMISAVRTRLTPISLQDDQREDPQVLPDIRTIAGIPVQIPNRIRVTEGSFALLESEGTSTLNINGFHASLTRNPRKLNARIASLKIGDSEETDIEARLQLSKKNGRYEFSVRRKKSELNLGWALKGEAAADWSSSDLSIDAGGMPSILTALPGLSSFVGPISPYLVLFSNLPQTGVRGSASISTADRQSWNVSSALSFDHVFVSHKSLGREAIGPFGFSLTTNMTYHQPTRKLVISNSRLGIPGRESTDELVVVAFSAAARLPVGHRGSSTLLAKVRIPPTSCQSALEVLPQMLAPKLDGFRLVGKFGANFDIRLESDAASSFSYKTFAPLFSCEVAEAPPLYRRGQLMAPFILERAGSSGLGTIEIPVNPASPAFAALPTVGRNVSQAIVSAEDAGFYAHNGVEWAAIEQAIRRNLTEKRIAIGGSTITMQTVKNLFLTNERTFGRKFQELFLAWHLDREIPKDRILEIYLNIAEFGPGIFGVASASRHFFGKPPADLTLREATYLASVLPAPVTRYRYFCLGKTSENFDELINTLLRRMHALGRISFEQFATALNEPLMFNTTSRLASSACHGVKQIAQREHVSESVEGE